MYVCININKKKTKNKNKNILCVVGKTIINEK